ncbi:MAG: thiamine pyrophosphate-dependent enzyme [Vicinamibacterales bacterium]
MLRALSEAIARTGRSPSELAIVTDIGCVGLADQLFTTPHTVHTTHGRSTAIALGLAMAHHVRGTGGLKPIVLIGDGGAMIGLNHLVHGSLVNADVTVLVHNNFLFGMTGGQNSVFSPESFISATTPHGSPVRPLDLARVLQGSHAAFLARLIAGDKALPDVLHDAIETPGFAVVEILELCTGFATRWNELTGTLLKEVAARASYELGVLQQCDRKPFCAGPPGSGESRRAGRAQETRPGAPWPALREPVRLVIGGTAGERVQTAALLLAGSALDGGVHVTLKNDYPVTQGTGFSVSELVLSPEPIDFTGIEHPDVVVVVSTDGARELVRGGMLSRLEPGARVIVDASVTLPPLPCAAAVLPIRSSVGGSLAAVAGVACWLTSAGAPALTGYRAAVESRLGADAAARVFDSVASWVSDASCPLTFGHPAGR